MLAAATSAQTNPYYLGGSVSRSHDSNLLRLVDGQVVPDGYSRADGSTSTALLAGLDQSIGRQHFYGNLDLRSNRFDRNSIYNNDAYTASAGLDWSTVERLSGSLAASANRSLASFNLQQIGLLAEKNLQSTQTLDAAVRWGLVTKYSLEATAGQLRVNNSLDTPAVVSRNFVQDSASLGLHWRPGGASNFGLALRETRGRYPQFQLIGEAYQADRFKRQDIDLSVSLQPSGASSLDLRLSNGRTRYDLNSERNFSGLTGALGWTWLATAKLKLNTRLSRDTGQQSVAVTTFLGTPGTVDYSRINNTFSLRTDYDASAKVSLNLALAYTDRELVDTLPTFFGPAGLTGREKDTTASFGARWVPTRSLMLGVDISRVSRQGRGALGTSLGASAYSGYAQFSLQ